MKFKYFYREENNHKRLDRADLAIIFALFIGTMVLLALTRDVGITRDGCLYLNAGSKYVEWFGYAGESFAEGNWAKPFSRQVIDRFWTANSEHPGFIKTLFGLAGGLFHDFWHIFPKITDAKRSVSWFFGALSVVLIYVLGRLLVNKRVGILSALMWLSQPRVFWHMHVSCFDIPVCAAHIWLVLGFFLLRRTFKGAIILAVLYGVAFSVKHNVAIFAVCIVIHWLFFELKKIKISKKQTNIFAFPWCFITMPIITPLVFILLWPHLWPDIWPRLVKYWIFHLKHVMYMVMWFGDMLQVEPFPVAFPFVMSYLTLPVPILILSIGGLILAAVVILRYFYRLFFGRTKLLKGAIVPMGAPLGETTSSAAFFLAINAVFPFVLIALPSTPVFGGTKHWMNGVPFLCILGAWYLEQGFVYLSKNQFFMKMRPRLNANALYLIFAGLIIAPGFLITLRDHPNGIGSYNALAGFARGAANIGMQRDIWGHQVGQALDEINRTAPRNARIFLGDTRVLAWDMYRRDGMARNDIRGTNELAEAQMAALQPQPELAGRPRWIRMQNEWDRPRPKKVIHVQGVPLLAYYIKE